MTDADIQLCPKGTRPFFTERRAGGLVRRQIILKCNCGCHRVAKIHNDSRPDKAKARAAVIQEWNNDMGVGG